MFCIFVAVIVVVVVVVVFVLAAVVGVAVVGVAVVYIIHRPRNSVHPAALSVYAKPIFNSL